MDAIADHEPHSTDALADYARDGHLGFRVMPDLEIGPALRAVRGAETAAGIDPATRVCMRLALTD